MEELRVDEKLLIAIDVGNSRIKLGLFKRDHIHTPERPLPVCLRSMAIEVDEEVPWDELAQWGNHHPTAKAAVILGGVNPRGRDKIVDGWPATGWPHPVLIDNPFMLPLEIHVDSPRTVGMDRLLNVVAGNLIRPKNKAMIIVDSGTATTIDLVSVSGAFEGGAILPGLQLGSRALHQYTALLPRILNEELTGNPADPLGKNTRDAIRAGLFWGQLGAVKELVRHMREQLGDDPVTVVTGGAGRLLAPLMSNVLHEPYLALQGLVVVAQGLNRN
ncbi:MAG TPA: type III pantothenate kinase [bacterium]